MARKISISFKETKKDLELYNFINSLDDKSSDIKKALREFYKKELNEEGVIESNKEKSENINILDF